MKYTLLCICELLGSKGNFPGAELKMLAETRGVNNKHTGGKLQLPQGQILMKALWGLYQSAQVEGG